MSDLNGRVAVVTGASAGIGEAIARDLAAHGAKVVVNARRKERLEALAKDIGEDRCAVAPGDAGDENVIRSMLDTAKRAFGKESDLVVVNAGRGLNGSVTTSDTGDWEEMIRTNLLGACLLMREAANRMVKGREDATSSGDWQKEARDLVVIGSTVGRHISPFSSMYGSTKFAVNSLGEALRREIGPKGVRVTLIEPGVVRSEFQQVAGYDQQKFSEFMDSIGPVLEPMDIAEVITWITSRPARLHVNDVVIRGTRQDYP